MPRTAASSTRPWRRPSATISATSTATPWAAQAGVVVVLAEGIYPNPKTSDPLVKPICRNCLFLAAPPQCWMRHVPRSASASTFLQHRVEHRRIDEMGAAGCLPFSPKHMRQSLNIRHNRQLFRRASRISPSPHVDQPPVILCKPCLLVWPRVRHKVFFLSAQAVGRCRAGHRDDEFNKSAFKASGFGKCVSSRFAQNSFESTQETSHWPRLG